jgi:uncharacterized membrane protein
MKTVDCTSTKAENARLNEEIEHLRARLEYKQGKLNELKEENARLTRELAELSANHNH